MRSYFIHKYRLVTWRLVFDEGPGKWHVERTGPHKAYARFPIDEFEKSDSGMQLRDAFSTALRAAELDV